MSLYSYSRILKTFRIHFEKRITPFDIKDFTTHFIYYLCCVCPVFYRLAQVLKPMHNRKSNYFVSLSSSHLETWVTWVSFSLSWTVPLFQVDHHLWSHLASPLAITSTMFLQSNCRLLLSFSFSGGHSVCSHQAKCMWWRGRHLFISSLSITTDCYRL